MFQCCEDSLENSQIVQVNIDISHLPSPRTDSNRHMTSVSICSAQYLKVKQIHSMMSLSILILIYQDW